MPRLPTRPITAVLFDLAGTLLVPRPAADWVVRAADELGVRMSDEELDALAQSYLAAGLPGSPYPASIPEHLTTAYETRDLDSGAHREAYVGLLLTLPEPCEGFAEAVYAQSINPDTWVPYADTAEVVGALDDAGIAMAVVSNAGFDLRPVLRHHGLEALAERCTLSFEHGAVKPDPSIFRAALDALGAEPQETLMVGDHPAADGGAAALGCPTLILPMSPPGARHGLDRVLRLVLG
jgi:HAD superfamily hydrolase (TIGR01509 family)